MRNIRKIISGILVLAVASTVFFTPSEGRDALAAEDTVEKTDQKEAFPENAATGKETPDNVVEDEIIIVYEDAGVSKKKSESIQEAARDALADMDIEVTQEVAAPGEEQGTVVAAEIPEEMGLEEAIKEVVKDDNVSYAQPNYRYEFMENVAEEVPEQQMLDAESIQINDTYKDAYYLKNTKVLEAWQKARCDRKVTVAVLDTGCRMDHEDLQGNLLRAYAYDAFYGKPLTSVPVPNGGDPIGHGTHVSGLVAAEANNGMGIAGTSYNANLLPVKLCDNNGKNMTTITLLRGMEYCAGLVDQGKVQNLRVMNISAGYYSDEGDVDEVLETEIEKLRDQYGILCVCAGGNGDGMSTPYRDTMYPSDFDACFSVTALDQNGNNCVWSDYNSAKDISAPGEGIISSAYSGKASYVSMSGTSMAAPIVSGICALFWAKDPKLTVDQVVSALESTADPVNSSAIDGRAGNSGSYGAVNAAKALDYLESDGDRINIKEKNVVVEGIPQREVYSGKRLAPEPTVKLGDTVLAKYKDYGIRYKNNVNAGTAQVVITGMGSYCGSITKEFTIEKASIANCTYRISPKNLPYTGAAVRPDITLYFNGRILNQGKDYTVNDEKNTEPGTASVLVRGCGTNFTKEGRIRFTIDRADIRNLPLALSDSSYTYNKKAKKPKVTVKNVSHTPAAGRDFKVSYTNNVKVGTATVTITGTGSRYTGTVKKTFRINPKGTAISRLTKKKKGFKASWKKQTAQTTGYQIQYATDKKFKNGKTKTIKKTKTTSVSVSKLKKKKTYYVRIRTYKTVGNTRYYSSWSGTKKVKTK